MQFMKRFIWFLGAFLTLLVLPLIPVSAAEETAGAPTATESAVATGSSEGTVLPIVNVIGKTDLTEPTGLARGKLEQYLLSKDPGPLSITNFLQHALRRAVALGVPANTLVLVLLFPLVGAVIAAARHLIGLRGFGLFTTAALSIAFLATGFTVGMLLFVIIILVASLGRVFIGSLKLQYLPRIALLLWFVSLGIFALLAVSPYLGLNELVTISIFPILLLVLFVETYIGSRIGVGLRRAIELTIETIILAVICYLVLSLESLQRFAVLNPELTVASVAVFDIFLGKYVGLRLLEYWRFRELFGRGD
jgi:hypothetical protein